MYHKAGVLAIGEFFFICGYCVPAPLIVRSEINYAIKSFIVICIRFCPHC